jgi:quercetin dioxygenase-like cupin family protein
MTGNFGSARESAMEAFELQPLLDARRRANRPYLEFLRVPALSAGLYVLPAGGVDAQKPHAEDEVYYVIRGRARMHVGEEDRGVEAGSIVFVPARVEHHFHEIQEELTLLVLFAPAESLTSSAAPPGPRPSGAGTPPPAPAGPG